jgi:DNA polymerase III subunit delta'
VALRNIIGQDKPVRILLGTIKRERVPSAVLLSGDSGIGKMLAALNYVKALNCLSPVDADACDKCQSCTKIDNASHADVALVLPENDEIKIESIRQAEEILSLKPYEGKIKVVIVDDADTMNIQAANAFLKTLEEPPPNSLIILVSSNPDRLPDTIRSRCMHVRFRPLSETAYRQILEQKAEGGDNSSFSGLSMGRPGIALTKNFVEERVWFIDILNAMCRGDSKCAWAEKSDIRLWLDLSIVWLRDIAVYSITGRETDLLYGSSRASSDFAALLDAGQKLQRVRSAVDMNLNKGITWNYVSGIIQSVAATARASKP